MAERKAKGLPEAEYYMLVDDRGESNFLYRRYKQYDDDPAVSEALLRAHHARWMAMDPTWGPYSGKTPPTWIPGARGDHAFPLSPELAPRAAAFKKDKPDEIPHFDFVYGYGYAPITGVYNCPVEIVSEAWKQAIESVEPGDHEFFPFELRFRDRIVTDHFMFRNRQALDIVDRPNSDCQKYTHPDGTAGYSLRSKPLFISLKRELVSGLHCFEDLDLNGTFFLSRELAVKIFHLLPKRCSLMPVGVSEAE